MASQIPDLLSDDPPPDLCSDSIHSDSTAPLSRTHPTTVPKHTLIPPSVPSPASSSPSSSGFLNYPFSRVANSITRRLTDPESPLLSSFSFGGPSSSNTNSSIHHSQHSGKPPLHPSGTSSLSSSAVFQAAPRRTASPFAPPPLSALSLTGFPERSRADAQILSTTLAEEIRLLLPARLQLTSEWTLGFSVEQDGVSLSTLYHKCNTFGGGRGARGGWVMVVKDGMSGVFGAFLTDPPHPSSSYYGTGECFLWRASIISAALILQSLPPPPSADTTNLTQRHTSLASPPSPDRINQKANGTGNRVKLEVGPDFPGESGLSGTETPDQIRFKAFPYSGVNDYLIYCEHDYLSVGGGDGRYGLWLDSNLEKGVSSSCMTFGNEALSDEGEKFEVLGIEMWHVGA